MENAAQSLRSHDDESRTVLEQQKTGDENGKRAEGGIVFVTFAAPEAAARAISAVNRCRTESTTRRELGALFEVSSAATPERAARIRARRAPEPSDVMWENLHVSPREQMWRQLASTLIMFAIACLGTGIIAVVGYFNGRGSIQSFVKGRLPFSIRANSILGLAVSTIIQLMTALPIILGNVIIFISVPSTSELVSRAASHLWVVPHP